MLLKIFSISLDINKKISIYFYSYSHYFQNNLENAPSCNKKISKEKKNNLNAKNNNLCYGAIFKCPEKEGNRSY